MFAWPIVSDHGGTGPVVSDHWLGKDCCAGSPKWLKMLT